MWSLELPRAEASRDLRFLVCSKRQPKWGIVSQEGDQCSWTWLVGDYFIIENPVD